MLQQNRFRLSVFVLFVVIFVSLFLLLQKDGIHVEVDLTQSDTLGVGWDDKVQKILPIYNTPYLVLLMGKQRTTGNMFDSDSNKPGSIKSESENHLLVLDLQQGKRVARCSWDGLHHYKADYWGLPIQSVHSQKTQCTVWKNQSGVLFLGLISSRSFSRHAIPDSFYSFVNTEDPVEKKSTVVHFTENRVQHSETHYIEHGEEVSQSFQTQTDSETDVTLISDNISFHGDRYLIDGYSWQGDTLVSQGGERFPLNQLLSKAYWNSHGSDSDTLLDAMPIRSAASGSFIFVLTIIPTFPLYKVTIVDNSPHIQYLGEGGNTVPVMAFDSNRAVLFQKMKAIHSHVFGVKQTLSVDEPLVIRRIGEDGRLENKGMILEHFPLGCTRYAVPLDDEHLLLRFEDGFWSYHHSGKKPPDRIFPLM